jgi:hypothetical protein
MATLSAAGWLKPRMRAAAENEPVVTTARNTRSRCRANTAGPVLDVARLGRWPQSLLRVVAPPLQ